MKSWRGRDDDAIYSPPPKGKEEADPRKDDRGREKRPAVLSRFVLRRELGVGSYNCTFLLDNGREVLRVGFLADDEGQDDANDSVLRGLEIVHVFQMFGSMLGPSLLAELSAYRVIEENELSQHVQGTLCKKILASQAEYNDPDLENEFALQHLEYLGAGLFNNTTYTRFAVTAEELCFSVFSLVWFFAAAQQYFSFRHHDLKSGNLMVRDTTDMHTYHFSVDDGTHRYQFKSHLVPVVIDYDFATVFTSLSLDDRDVGGTHYTCSPDAAIFLLHEKNYDAIAYEDHAYDWWSLGVCILEFVLPTASIWGLFETLQHRFVNNALRRLSYLLDTKYTRSVLRGFFMSCCYAALVHGGSVRPPITPAYGDIAENDAVWKGWDKAIRKHADFKTMHRALRKNIPAALLKFLQRLLSWNPAERNAGGYPMDVLLESSYFDKYRTKAAAQPAENVHLYSGSLKGILEDGQYVKDIQITDRPFLALQICSECSLIGAPEGIQLYMCECCAQVFCGEACQRKRH